MNFLKRVASSIELKVPPLLFVFMFAWGMWFCPPVLMLPIPGMVCWVGFGVLLFLGMALIAVGLSLFFKAQTSANPATPSASSSLVVAGVYGYTRNPMYLGMLLSLTAWALLLAKLLAWLFLPLFVVCLTRFQIIPEERALHARFGATFDDYAKRVRRWW